MIPRHITWLGCALLGLAPLDAPGGGSGLNLAVVVNQASSNSVALGNHYAERRQVPPQNFLRIHWTGGNVQWTLEQFESVLAAPLRAMLASRGLSHQIDYVALSMDIPYRVAQGNDLNSTTAALFYGFKTEDQLDASACRLSTNSPNLYAFSELPFRLSSTGANPAAFLVAMLTSDSLEAARSLVDRGVASDGSLPTQAVMLAKTSDAARNVRYLTADNTVFDARIHGRMSVFRTHSDQTLGLTNLLGLQTGLATLGLSPNAFVPGAMADSLTSFGGMLFENSGQTPLLAFINSGAAGSYGTVIEPCNYLEKFPDPLAYFYQARGFSLAECYYQSLANPYQGLIVAEPLAAPFAWPGSGRWVGLESNTVLSGGAALSLEFQAAEAARPLHQIDLFVDGVLVQTLTNLGPTAGNVISVSLNGFATNYTVPPGATLASVSGGVAATLNALSGLSGVAAIPYGDRLELESLDWPRPGSQIPTVTSNSIGSADALTTFLAASRPTFLDSVAAGRRSWQVGGEAFSDDFLSINVTKTNGQSVSLAVTNPASPLSTAGLVQQLMAMIDSTPALQGEDGVMSGDAYIDGPTNLQFFIYARAAGWPAARVQLDLQASGNLVISPAGPARLEENVTDLRPRNHLHLTAGSTNLALGFTLDTTALADGDHELTAVACEGSSVRTQTRATQRVRVRNTSLFATFATTAALGVAAVGDTLRFAVTANTNAVASIELFSTGGTLGVVSNQAMAEFSVAGTFLGAGLHPFYALVIGTDGARFRTEPLTVRLSDAPLTPPFQVRVNSNPVTLTWPGVAGSTYEVWSADGLTNLFQPRGDVTTTNTGPAQWTEPETSSAQRFYHVRGRPTPAAANAALRSMRR